MSVHIVDYKERQNAEGEPFFVLILEGDIEMIQSQETKRYYATARRASMTSTFNEETCQRLVGKQLAGSIQKVDCEAYEYTIPETGEIVTLTHRYEFVPEGAPKPSLEKEVFGGNGAQAANAF